MLFSCPMGIRLGGTHSLWGWSHWDSAILWGSGSRRLGGTVHDSSQPTLFTNHAWLRPGTSSSRIPRITRHMRTRARPPTGESCRLPMHRVGSTVSAGLVVGASVCPSAYAPHRQDGRKSFRELVHAPIVRQQPVEFLFHVGNLRVYVAGQSFGFQCRSRRQNGTYRGSPTLNRIVFAVPVGS